MGRRLNVTPLPSPGGRVCGWERGRGGGDGGEGRRPRTLLPSYFRPPTSTTSTIAWSTITTNGRGSTWRPPLPSCRTTCTVPMP